jgi:hypothetical protein
MVEIVEIKKRKKVNLMNKEKEKEIEGFLSFFEMKIKSHQTTPRPPTPKI